jgi:uroporphyrinogen decarboxylase
MIEGQGSKTFEQALRFIYMNKSQAIYLRDLLQETIIQHLISQIDAGVDVVQLFDSWAGMVPAPLYEQWVIQPHINIVSNIRRQRPNIPIICFPRGSGVNLLNFVTVVQPNALSIDTATNMQWAVDNFQNDNVNVVVQGNLDPALLCAGGADLTNAVNTLKSICKNRRWIMNLGHGVLPQTSPDNLAQVISLIRNHE